MTNPYAYTNPILRLLAGATDMLGRIVFFTIPKNQPIGSNSVKKILTARFDLLGDAFYFSPTLEYLKQKFPMAKLDVVATDWNATIFEHNPNINSLWRLNYGRFIKKRSEAKRFRAAGWRDILSTAAKLRREKYDLFIDPRGEPLTSILGFMSSRYRLGIAHEEFLSFLYTHPIRYDPMVPAWHRYRSILQKLGVKAMAWRPVMYPTDAERRRVSKMITQTFRKPFLAFHITAGQESKIWPRPSFASLFKTILANHDYELAILGGPSDYEAVEMVVQTVKSDRLKNLVGQLNMRETYCFLARAKAFVGNDSVLAHLAAANDIPTIELMNRASPFESCQAVGRKVEVVIGADPDHRCRHVDCPYPCPNMAALSAATVYSVVKKFIA